MPLQQLIETFGSGPAFVARAPGRVNLIGDHTDYNGGFVLPMAIDRDVRIAFRPADDDRVELVSVDFKEKAAFELSSITPRKESPWLNYPMGVAAVLQQEGYSLRGLRGVVKGNIPIGAGLSSSAAVEVAFAKAICTASGLSIHREKLARICQRAENEFVGMKCGIMDQFTSLLARKGRALFIDCTSLSTEAVPLDAKKAVIVVCDSGVKRELVKSPYNQRRKECAKAFILLRRHLPDIKTYRDLSIEALRAYGQDLPDPLFKRAHHVVTENRRVLEAVRALTAGDMIEFGALMDASHDSLRRDFEVSCSELDLLVGLAREAHGTYGARLTGAGFGGCTVNFVRPEYVEEFVKSVSAGYLDEKGRVPDVHVFTPSEGASVESEGTP